jgi:hypothetical protein
MSPSDDTLRNIAKILTIMVEETGKDTTHLVSARDQAERVVGRHIVEFEIATRFGYFKVEYASRPGEGFSTWTKHLPDLFAKD